MSVLNNPQNRDITVSSLTGTGTARGLAKLYGIVANGGTENQHELLSADMIRELSTPVVSGEDMVLRTGNFSRNGPGTMLMSSPLVRREPRHEISNNVVCATSIGSDQPAHTRSLIRAFAGRLNIL